MIDVILIVRNSDTNGRFCILQPSYPPAGTVPPPVPNAPPAAGSPYPPPGPASYTYPAYPPPDEKPGPPPNFNDLYDNPKPAQPPPAGFMNSPPPPGPPPKMDDAFPDLPTVPNNSLPDSRAVGGNSAGGEDVDFDDLTRRFEALKKRKWHVFTSFLLLLY